MAVSKFGTVCSAPEIWQHQHAIGEASTFEPNTGFTLKLDQLKTGSLTGLNCCGWISLTPFWYLSTTPVSTTVFFGDYLHREPQETVTNLWLVAVYVLESQVSASPSKLGPPVAIKWRTRWRTLTRNSVRIRQYSNLRLPTGNVRTQSFIFFATSNFCFPFASTHELDALPCGEGT